MSYKTMLMPWDTPTGQVIDPAADTAAALARRFGAHLVVMATGVEPGIAAYGFGGPGAATIAMQSAAAAEEAEARRSAAAAWLTERAQTDAPLVGEARVITGPLEVLSDLLAQEVRVVDLAIMPAPYAIPEREDLAVALLEAALFEGSVPVLVFPSTPMEVIGRRVIIAWDGGVEATHALRGAMPFLKEAEAVEVTLVDPEVAADGDEAPGAAVVRMLQRHGVKAEVALLESGGRRVGRVLCDRFEETSADLLVMGAYSHSRLREALIGGPTREILKTVPGPVLMAH